MRERQRRSDPRQELAQSILDLRGERALEEHITSHPEREMNFDLLLDGSDNPNLLETELSNVIYNHQLSLDRLAAAIGARQVAMVEHMAGVFREPIDDGVLDRETRALSVLEAPHPPQYLTVIQRLNSISDKALFHVEGRTSGYPPELTKGVHLRTDALAVRVQKLYDLLLKAEGHTVKRKPSEKVLHSIWRGQELFSQQEQADLLAGLMSETDALARLGDSGVLASVDQHAQDINNTFSINTVLAGSYAIEEKYPGISSRDATRLLLQNADILGLATHVKFTTALYDHITPKTDLEGMGTFPMLVDLISNTNKMELDTSDRLTMPYDPRYKGRCPASYVYDLDPRSCEVFRDFRNSIAAAYDYDITLPSIQWPTIALATEYMMMAILVGRDELNGKAHDMIGDFRKALLGEAATKFSHMVK